MDMRVSRAQAEQNRDRVVETAGRLFREKGFDGIGLNDLMQAAGLTRGGFYGHFESKEDLVALASGRALAANVGLWAELGDLPRDEALARLVRFYLSDRHCEARAEGCALAALAGDAARQGEAVKAAFGDGVEGFLGVLAGLVEGTTPAHQREQAIVTLSTLVGALLLSRAVDDKTLSSEIRGAARRALDGERTS
jgi:TetR/AcrR family transcriptional regulator, transcriptional repressor for nem operon